MHAQFKRTLLAASVVVLLSACHPVEPVYSVDHADVQYNMEQKISAEKVGSIIKKAALADRWVVKTMSDSKLRCTNSWKNHEAVIDITYSSQSYSINLVSSENLKEKDGMIHHKYNQLVHKLQHDIDHKLSQAS